MNSRTIRKDISTNLSELSKNILLLEIENNILLKKLKEANSTIQLQSETMALQKKENQEIQNKLNLYRNNLKATHNAFNEYKDNIIEIHI